MLNILFYILLCLATTLIMEIVAILTHKYIMHGPGWFLHKSHHENHDDTFEKNDFYFLIFSIPSILFISIGAMDINYTYLSIGVGILLYGLIYLFLHDMMVHKRFNKKYKIKNSYLKKVQRAHLIHHSNKNKDGGVHFGFIYYK